MQNKNGQKLARISDVSRGAKTATASSSFTDWRASRNTLCAGVLEASANTLFSKASAGRRNIRTWIHNPTTELRSEAEAKPRLAIISVRTIKTATRWRGAPTKPATPSTSAPEVSTCGFIASAYLGMLYHANRLIGRRSTAENFITPLSSYCFVTLAKIEVEDICPSDI